MENILAKIEAFIEKKFSQFEAHPIKTSIELYFIFLILKKIMEKMKE